MGAPQYEQAGADIGGSGTTNTIPRWTGASTLGDSGITDNGSTVSFVGRNLSSTAAQTWTLNTSLSLLSGVTGFYNAGTDGTYGDVIYIGAAAYPTTYRHRIKASVSATTTNALMTFSLNSGTSSFTDVMTLRGDGNVGIGTPSPAARVHSVAADGTYQLALAGTTKGIRFQTTAAQSQIDGVDSTLVGSYQPLAINGSTLGFLIGGVTKAGINGSSQLYVSTNGTAASPVICESTGVSGMYFPSATTVAIAANGAIAATFSKVAGAGVALGGTTGLVFDASGTQQGLKLPATPGNADTQTLDCYAEGTWTPTLTGFGGTTPTVSAARYTRMGRVVTLQVKLSSTAAASFSSTAGSTYLTLPSGMTAAVEAPGSTSSSGITADGSCVAYTNGNLYLPTFILRTADTFVNVTYTV